MPRFAPPPPLADETGRALLAIAAEFEALKPWTFTHESDLVGLFDPVTGETRIGSVLGNGGAVFAAVFYRRGGLRWVLQMVSEEPDPESLDTVEGNSAKTPATEAARRGLMKGLLNAGALPEKLMVGRPQLQPMLEPFCAALKIKLQPASSLPSLDEAMDALTQRFAGGMI